MIASATVLLVIVFIAGLYMAWNIGANDVANAIGTSVGSGALTLKQAVIMAAVLEFCGAYFFGSHVADTVQQGIVNPDIFSGSPIIFVLGMLSALIASGLWLQLASYWGLPVSTTHSIVGAVVGFGAIVGGIGAVYWENVVYIGTAWILSPLIGGTLSFFIFSTLRKKIFYASCPIEAAKRLTPKIVFVFVATLSLIMMFRGLSNINIDLSFTQALLASITIATLSALICHLCVRKMQPQARGNLDVTHHNPEAVKSMEKAEKHLKMARKISTGEMAYKLTLSIEELRLLMAKAKARDRLYNTDYNSVERIFGYLQMMSASLMAFAHGANDVANAIGPLAAAATTIMTGNVIIEGAAIPPWALALGGIGIVIGLATWGWRVVETIGNKITELTPSRGFSAEFGAALTIVLASRLGLPISTTHTLVGAVLGVGLARGIEALNLSTTRDIFISWIVTVPAGAGLSICTYYLLSLFFIS